MNQIEKVALVKSSKSLTALSKELPTGNYSGTFTALLSYDLRRGEDHTQQTYQKLKPMKALLMALSHLNEQTRAHVLTAMFENYNSVDETEPILAEIKDEVLAEYGKVAEEVNEIRNGKITGSVEVLEVTTTSESHSPLD